MKKIKELSFDELVQFARLDDYQKGHEKAQLALADFYLKESKKYKSNQKENFIKHLKLLMMASRFKEEKHNTSNFLAQYKLFTYARKIGLLEEYLTKEVAHKLKVKLSRMAKNNYSMQSSLKQANVSIQPKKVLTYLNSPNKQGASTQAQRRGRDKRDHWSKIRAQRATIS